MHDFINTIFLPQDIEVHSTHFIPDYINLMWFTIFSNGLIFISYLLIPLTVAYLVKHRKDLVYNWVFLLIGLFILLCGFTHLLHIVVYWYSFYGLLAFVEVVTAITSFITAIVLLFIIPKVSKMTTPEQMKEIASSLNKEIDKQKMYEEELLKTNQDIELTNDNIWETNRKLLRLNEVMKGRDTRINELEEELKKLQEK